MKPIIDIRVVQDLEWFKDANAGWLQVPTKHKIEFKREGSDDWEPLDVIINEIANPEKDAENE